jgi:hypothetical protein
LTEITVRGVSDMTETVILAGAQLDPEGFGDHDHR